MEELKKEETKPEKVKTEIESAYEMLSTLHVSGDAVDVMAAARSKLRKAFELVSAIAEVKSDG